MANSTYRVTIPKNVEELLNLAASVYKKHTDLGAASPLNSMVSHKWADNGPNVASCLALHKQAEELKRQAEETYRQRDLLLGEITDQHTNFEDLALYCA